MKENNRRVMLVLVDQLAGHWVEDVLVKSTGLPPPNVEEYHIQGLIPHISELIEEGVWVRHPYNMGECWTGPGQQYIVMGSYKSKKDSHHIAQFLKRYDPSSKTAFFEEWTSKYVRGDLFDYSADTDNGLVPNGTLDDELLENFVMPWMKKNEGWSFLFVHLDDHDYGPSPTPVFVPDPVFPTEDKHHHLVDHVDPNIGRITDFLKKEGLWDETFVIICSDHAYHLGCDIESDNFLGITRSRYGPALSTNYCWGHPEPYDCHVWDFKTGKPSEKLSQCCRRVTFILSGGALDEKFRGKQIEKAEIIDIAPTIADIFSLQHPSEGESILKKVH